MTIPNYVATPHSPADEVISCHGVGDTIAKAVAQLEQDSFGLRLWAEYNDNYGGDITINVYKACSPEAAGWDDNPNEYEWCVTGESVHTLTVAYPPLEKPAKET